MVSAINFYFTDEKNKTLTPLHKAYKRGTSGSKWKQAYQAVKHDRRNSLKKANIKNLLHALGALYILNLYYRDERTDIGCVYLTDHDFDNRAGSEIFSAHYCRATVVLMQPHMDDRCIVPPIGDELNKAIYIIKYDDASFKRMYKNYCLDSQISIDRFKKSTEIQKFLADHPEYREKTIEEICMAAGGVDLHSRIICSQYTKQEKSTRIEAMLNKHSDIYPELYPGRLPLEDG
ncbi:hypothetical protein H6G85_11845 [Megasphaera stantonii]|nr:hypothetical protein [Megasphaera stantonii]